MLIVIVVLICVGYALDFDFILRKDVVMDLSWIKFNRLSDEYENEIIQFLDFSKKNISDNKGLFSRPCKICGNGMEFVKII